MASSPARANSTDYTDKDFAAKKRELDLKQMRLDCEHLQLNANMSKMKLQIKEVEEEMSTTSWI